MEANVVDKSCIAPLKVKNSIDRVHGSAIVVFEDIVTFKGDVI